ncbi:D-aminoacyl-tRNA deacylase [Puniceicoccaceae bacterium K14]|nr:D-aminoacyl-tRNA deacylase [Puniceicoccaceae bacterium K14]
MKAIVQRVTEASVTIDGTLYSSIKKGFLVLLGVHREDTPEDVVWITRKIIGMRVFEDDKGQMNTTLADVDGDILVVSQFTLIASNRKGNRPSFNEAAPPELGKKLYLETVSALTRATGKEVATGIFAADMKVSLINDGPVTITLDTRNKE